jgi:hypothetical protein
VSPKSCDVFKITRHHTHIIGLTVTLILNFPYGFTLGPFLTGVERLWNVFVIFVSVADSLAVGLLLVSRESGFDAVVADQMGEIFGGCVWVKVHARLRKN